MYSELLLGAALLILAAWVAYRAVRTIGRGTGRRKPNTPVTVQARLPVAGEPGSIGKDQLRVLKKLAVPGVDYKALSKEQAEILLDCVAYVQSVWETDLQRRFSELPARSLEESLTIILDHDSYRERVVTWHQGIEDENDLFVPDDACHAAVKFHLAQTA
jgi:hypothetical protein